MADTDSGAFFELHETTKVATAWFFDYPGGDMMAMVFADDADAPWKLVIRIRHRLDDKPPDESADTKTGYRIVREADDASRDELVTETDNMLGVFKDLQSGSRLWREEVNGSAAEFLKRWAKMSFSHTRLVADEPKTPQ